MLAIIQKVFAYIKKTGKSRNIGGQALTQERASHMFGKTHYHADIKIAFDMIENVWKHHVQPLVNQLNMSDDLILRHHSTFENKPGDPPQAAHYDSVEPYIQGDIYTCI